MDSPDGSTDAVMRHVSSAQITCLNGDFWAES